MVKFTRRRKVHRKQTKRRRGGGPPGFLAGLGATMLKKSQGPPPSNSGPGPSLGALSNNDPLAKYKKMLKMGQPQGAIEQKMLTNGKNPKNIFPNYVPQAVVAPVKVVAGFTLDDFRDLRDYVSRSEIVARMQKSGINPAEIYPEITAEEITSIVEEYSKPRVAKVSNAPTVTSSAPKMSMKNAILAATKGRGNSVGVKQNITYFTEYTAQEQTDLNTIDSSKARIKAIETNDLVAAKKSIKTAEEKGQQIKDFQLKAILALLKEKRDLEALISKLNTEKLKNKVKFVRGQEKRMLFSEDSSGPLPSGWKVVVNSENSMLYYEDKYLRKGVYERPTEPAEVPELPEGWIMQENDENAWYINTLTGKSQWVYPTEPAQMFNTTGYERYSNPNGSFGWQKPVNGSNSWFEMRNANSVWYENPTNYQNTRFNAPDGKML
jgi:hypothetical protein